MVVPAPFCWNAPLPEVTPPNVNVSERLTAKVPLFVTLPTIDPLAPPLPSCRLPAVIVVPPEYVLAPESVSAPLPILVRPPLPEIVPENVVLVLSVPVVSVAEPSVTEPPGPTTPAPRSPGRSPVVVLVLSVPVVSVAEPSVTEPAPARDPIVWLKPLRLSMAPEATVNALPGAKAFAAPACSVPALTDVAPE